MNSSSTSTVPIDPRSGAPAGSCLPAGKAVGRSAKGGLPVEDDKATQTATQATGDATAISKAPNTTITAGGGSVSAQTAGTKTSQDTTGSSQQAQSEQTTTATSGNATPTTEHTSANRSGKPHPDESRFDIPEFVRMKYPDLIPLVLETESMNDEERQYWFHILPIMTPEQVNKFRAILVNEKEQLSKLDREYENELSNLNAKNPNAANIYKTKEKQKELRKEEAREEAAEKAKEEDILKQLGTL